MSAINIPFLPLFELSDGFQCALRYSCPPRKFSPLRELLFGSFSFLVANIAHNLEYSKFLSKNNFHNINNVNGLIENWLNEVKNYLNEYPREDLKRVIQWLNAYVNNN